MFRKRKSGSGDSLADFWKWWSAGGSRDFARSIQTGTFGSLPDVMSAHVHAIDPELVWELSAGRVAQHALYVGAAGDAHVRPLAERWLRSAPAPDATWEYVAAKRPDPNVLSSSLEIAGKTFVLADLRTRVVVNEPSQLVEVMVFHPEFADVDEDARLRVAFLALESVLGEDDVERWLGALEATTEVLPDGLPLDAVLETVKALAARHTEPGWAVLEVRTEGGARLMVSVLRPLRWIDHPLLDQHLGVSVPYAVLPDGDGLPPPAELERIRALEDTLVDALEDHAMLVAHETAAGFRQFHLYSDSTDDAVVPAAMDWGLAHGVEVDVERDPGWSIVRPYR